MMVVLALLVVLVVLVVQVQRDVLGVQGVLDVLDVLGVLGVQDVLDVLGEWCGRWCGCCAGPGCVTEGRGPPEGREMEWEVYLTGAGGHHQGAVGQAEWCSGMSSGI